ncbi:MAG TPA: TPM domain-containing protein [Pyrinomonadaceae bacterium]|nr:TPM domain-containing protein [Pyrinomonadaceae bacterium]
MQRMILLVAVIALAASGAAAQAQVKATGSESLPARPKSYVGDYAKVIDARAERRLETKLAGLRKRAAIEFVVVTLETTGAEDIFDYSLAAAQRWKLARGAGDKGGILLMLAMRDRKWRVQLTDSLRNDTPEAVLREHGERMAAAMRRNDTSAGVEVFVDGLVAHLAARRGFKNTPD